MATLNPNTPADNEQFEDVNINELKCAKCHEIFLSRPVILECENVVCDLHLYKYEDSDDVKTYVCPLCEGVHSIDFERDENLDSRVIRYKYKKRMSEIRTKLNEYALVEKDPKQYIINYFANLKTKITHRKAEVESIVSNHFLELVERLWSGRENIKNNMPKKRILIFLK